METIDEAGVQVLQGLFVNANARGCKALAGDFRNYGRSIRSTLEHSLDPDKLLPLFQPVLNSIHENAEVNDGVLARSFVSMILLRKAELHTYLKENLDLYGAVRAAPPNIDKVLLGKVISLIKAEAGRKAPNASSLIPPSLISALNGVSRVRKNDSRNPVLEATLKQRGGDLVQWMRYAETLENSVKGSAILEGAIHFAGNTIQGENNQAAWLASVKSLPQTLAPYRAGRTPRPEGAFSEKVKYSIGPLLWGGFCLSHARTAEGRESPRTSLVEPDIRRDDNHQVGLRIIFSTVLQSALEEAQADESKFGYLLSPWLLQIADLSTVQIYPVNADIMLQVQVELLQGMEMVRYMFWEDYPLVSNS